jgi:CRISPR-associated protein Cas2
VDYLITYDIDTTEPAGNRRLARVAAICEGYGLRAQDSVFEMRLSEPMLARLSAKLRDAIDPHLDSVHVYKLSGPCHQARTSLGRRATRTPGQPWIT